MSSTGGAIGVIQARMGSSRVPGKALLDIGGRPLIGHIIDRLRMVRGLDDIVLATTADTRNEELVVFCASEGLGSFRHSEEDDIAGRIFNVIQSCDAAWILKTHGDCPLVDPDVLQKLLDTAQLDPTNDFVSNRIKWSYPLGLSADVISRRAIEWAHNNLQQPEDREFFATYIRDHPERFKITPVVNDIDLSDLTWTVDEIDDIPWMRDVFRALYQPGQVFGMKDVLRYLDTLAGAA